MAEPFPKSRQLARGERRYRRKVASPKQWQRIIAAKQGPCRVCVDPTFNGGLYSSAPALIEFHHLVPRDLGGDDVADNIVPLCGVHHELVTVFGRPECERLRASLTAAERAYVVGRLGEDGLRRLFGAARA